jgi:hypothetical protein
VLQWQLLCQYKKRSVENRTDNDPSICGLRYGGSSSAKDDGRPFNIVLDSIFDTNSVMKIPKVTIPVRARVEVND